MAQKPFNIFEVNTQGLSLAPFANTKTGDEARMRNALSMNGRTASQVPQPIQSTQSINTEPQEQRSLAGRIGRGALDLGIGALTVGNEIPRYAGNLIGGLAGLGGEGYGYIADQAGFPEVAQQSRSIGPRIADFGASVSNAGRAPIARTTGANERTMQMGSDIASTLIPGAVIGKLAGVGKAGVGVLGNIGRGVGVGALETQLASATQEGKLASVGETAIGAGLGGAGAGLVKVGGSVAKFFDKKAPVDELLQAGNPTKSFVKRFGEPQQARSLIANTQDDMIRTGYVPKEDANVGNVYETLQKYQTDLYNKRLNPLLKQAGALVSVDNLQKQAVGRLQKSLGGISGKGGPTFEAQKKTLLEAFDELRSVGKKKGDKLYISLDQLEKQRKLQNTYISSPKDINQAEKAARTTVIDVLGDAVESRLNSLGDSANEVRKLYRGSLALEESLMSKMKEIFNLDRDTLRDIVNGTEGASEIISGIITANPSSIIKGASQYAINTLSQGRFDPNSLVRRSFENRARELGVSIPSKWDAFFEEVGQVAAGTPQAVGYGVSRLPGAVPMVTGGNETRVKRESQTQRQPKITFE